MEFKLTLKNVYKLSRLKKKGKMIITLYDYKIKTISIHLESTQIQIGSCFDPIGKIRLVYKFSYIQ